MKSSKASAASSEKNLSVALVAELSGDIKCASHQSGQVFTAESAGPLRSYNSTTGLPALFADRERDKAVTALACVKGELWAGTATGDLAVYNLANGELVVKPFLAHKDGVFCITAAHTGDGAVVVTGGADFQVKVWGPGGAPWASSGQHHGAVKSLLWLSADAVLGVPGALWSGSADAVLFEWADANGDMKLGNAAAEGRALKSGGSTGAAPGVSSLCYVSTTNEVWAGYDDGKMRAWPRQGGSATASAAEMASHKGTVSSIAVMGVHVWSAGADRALLGGYVRCCLRVGWALWAFNSKNIK
eukprot:gene17508-20845_t